MKDSELRASGEYEVAVVGGGLAGSSLAAVLAREGRDVALLEREEFPRDKLCGEFLSPEAQDVLGELGCLDEVLAASPARVTRARFTAPGGRALEVDLPGVGLGISRRVLDEIVLGRAAVCGAATFTATEVVGVSPVSSAPGPVDVRVRSRAGAPVVERVLRASAVVVAHGSRGRLDRPLGRRCPDRRRTHVGVKRHLVPASRQAEERVRADLQGMIEVHAIDGGYCGVGLVEGGRVNVCALLRDSFVQRLPSTGWGDITSALAGANRALADRLEALVPADQSAMHTVAGFSLRHRSRSSGPVLFVGDAAGVIAPMCGDGQAMALRSGVLAARMLARVSGRLTTRSLRDLEREWDQIWRREFALRVRVGRWLQSLIGRPVVASGTLRALGLAPAVARALVRLTRGPIRGRPSR